MAYNPDFKRDGFSKPDSPCLTCGIRNTYCHEDCLEYKKYKQKIDEQKERYTPQLSTQSVWNRRLAKKSRKK